MGIFSAVIPVKDIKKMNNISDAVVHLWGAITSLAALGFSFVFDVPAAWVFAAFAGAYAGVFFGDPVSRKMSIGLVIAGTIIGGWGVGILLHNPHLINLESGNYAARAISGGLGFIGIHYRELLSRIIVKVLNKIGGVA